MSRGPPDVEGMTSLKVDNLTFRTTIEDLRRAFDKYGDVGDVYIPRDRFTRESRGFAFVRFYDKRDGEDAMDSMDGAILDGRELRVQEARYGRPEGRRGRGGNRYGGGGGGSGGYRRYGGGGGGGHGGGGRYRSRSRSPRRRSNNRSRSRSRSVSRGRRSRSRSPQHAASRSRSRSPRKSPARSRSPSNRGSKSPHD